MYDVPTCFTLYTADHHSAFCILHSAKYPCRFLMSLSQADYSQEFVRIVQNPLCRGSLIILEENLGKPWKRTGQFCRWTSLQIPLRMSFVVAHKKQIAEVSHQLRIRNLPTVKRFITSHFCGYRFPSIKLANQSTNID